MWKKFPGIEIWKGMFHALIFQFLIQHLFNKAQIWRSWNPYMTTSAIRSESQDFYILFFFRFSYWHLESWYYCVVLTSYSIFIKLAGWVCVALSVIKYSRKYQLSLLSWLCASWNNLNYIICEIFKVLVYFLWNL